MSPVAVVTGASGGVGRATVRAFAEAGYDVGLLARGTAGLDAAAAEVAAAGMRACSCPTDAADADQVEAAATRIEEELGPIEVWVNDAMTTVFSPVADIEPADFQRAVEVTFLGQVWGTTAALRRMRPRDHGTIVNVGSALAFMGIPLQSPYCASKFACRGFVESVRAELRHEGSHVRISMVHLPAVNTPQFDWCKNNMRRRAMPVPPIYQPEIAADRILRSARSGKRSRIVGSWNTALVAIGQVAPGFANRYAARGAWEAQLTGDPNDAAAPVNLYEAVDADRDHGAHGRFDECAGGFLDPSFLRTLPRTAKTFAATIAATLRGA